MNAVEAAQFLTTGERPPHDQDQLDMYADLLRATPGLTHPLLGEFFKEASFGVRPANRERTYSPRADVTIVRDHFGVPHIYGSGRAGTMFGAGYVAAEDRLFLIDALRHAGRAQLSSFVGGSEGNRQMDREVWADTPYRSDAELQFQFDRGPERFGAEGAQIQRDVESYVAGINRYISEARANPLKMPAEYAAIGRPQGPEDWKVTDVIATASLVAGIFGKGGGNELGSALVLEEARKRFGPRRGLRVWRDFRRAEDPEAPVSVRGQRFPYQPTPRRVRGRALPDPGTTRHHQVVASSAGGARAEARAGQGELPDAGDLLASLRELGGGSNALLVSGRLSRSGRPLAVMGPQVSYFTPQLLMEQAIHAPGGPSGPPLDARGTSFPGTNLYVQLGRGRDYAWSATSAGQDIVDTFAVALCEPDGSEPTLDSMHYRFRGECLPIEVLERTNSWVPTPADQTPPGSETLRAERTNLGIVTARARIDGRPHAYTRLRATYFHEVDSAGGFADFNNPERIRSARDFMRAASKIEYTFNWFYVDGEDIAYFNSGANPRRAANVDPNFPVRGTRRFEWRGYQPPPILISERHPPRQRPQSVNQGWMTSWNNKQARGYRAADDNWSFGPVHRSTRLDRRIRAQLRTRGNIKLPGLVDAMQEAATVDTRAEELLPLLLRALRPQTMQSKRLRRAVGLLHAWHRSPHRRDRTGNGTYEHTRAVRIMDAWWPRLVRAQFRPRLGAALFEEIQSMIGLHDAPGPVGSAFIAGWYGYVHKDLRAVLGRRVRDRFSHAYCGGGRLALCRKRLRRSLGQALGNMSDDRLYPGQPDSACEGLGDAQWCNDAVRHSAVGVITQPPIHWTDRPTFQQVVEVEGPRP